MNIKRLTPHKGLFRHLLNLLPIDQMEFDIQQNSDPLIEMAYKSFKIRLSEIKTDRGRRIFRQVGISAIYVFFDPVWGQPIRNILIDIKDININPIPPKNWRINQEEK